MSTRSGIDRPWLQAPGPAAAEKVAALTALLPRIETERLILRAPRLSDWPVLEPIWTTERGRFIGGPMSAEEAWLDFNQCISSWLLRGYGFLTITAKADGQVLGLVGIGQEHGDPEPELGWLLTAEAEGNGYAIEAAHAMLPLGHDLIGAGQFVSYVDAGNARSIRLAERLGATRDEGHHPLAANCLIFRHSQPELRP